MFKGDTIKELVHSLRCSIAVMKLAMLDKEIRDYLLYSLLSMQCAMAKQLMLPYALFDRTESNKD